MTLASRSERPLRPSLAAVPALVPALALALGALAACSDGGAPASSPAASSAASSAGASLEVTSTSFPADGAIPAVHTCDGEDRSPQLSWSAGPDGTVGYAVTVTDPDASGFVHWVLTNLPADTTSLDEGVQVGADGTGTEGAVQGLTGFGKPRYGGPCPPSGTHHYVVTVYALGSAVEGSSPSVADVAAAALATGTLTGTYAAG